MRTYGKYGAVLIGLYLVVYHGTNAGKLLASGADGSVKVVKALQGR